MSAAKIEGAAARELRRLAADGYSRREIAATLRVHHSTVATYCQRHGVGIASSKLATSKRRVPDSEIPVVAALYADQWTTEEIARRYGVTAPTVNAWLREAGVPLRRSGTRVGVPLRRAKIAALVGVHPHAPVVAHIAPTPTIPQWRCLDCGARVRDATTCPKGHAAPWAVAA
jgi:hypothetical protein